MCRPSSVARLEPTGHATWPDFGTGLGRRIRSSPTLQGLKMIRGTAHAPGRERMRRASKGAVLCPRVLEHWQLNNGFESASEKLQTSGRVTAARWPRAPQRSPWFPSLAYSFSFLVATSSFSMPPLPSKLVLNIHGGSCVRKTRLQVCPSVQLEKTVQRILKYFLNSMMRY